MNLKRLCSVRDHSAFADISLLLIRLVVGLAFMFHGWPKLQQPFGWMPAESALPGFLQALAAISEFGGGLAWILGLLTPLASFGIACTMAVGFSMHAFVWGDPFVGSPRSFEPAAAYFCVAILLIAMGPGRFSLDRKLCG